jgi:hypothetical protein
MDDRTRAATYQDLLYVAELLEQERVEYAVIGGYALALQGIVRLTEDVDILLKMKEHGRLKDRADAEAIRTALQSNDS